MFGPFLLWRSGTLHMSVLGSCFCCRAHDEAPSPVLPVTTALPRALFILFVTPVLLSAH